MAEGRPTALLLGATGRTGRRVLAELLARDVTVRAIVRSAGRLPDEVRADPRLTVTVAELLSLGDDDLAAQVRGCDAVLSCLGHVISLRGVLGPPHDLVTRATARLCRAIDAAQPAAPVRFVLMSSVSVNHPGEAEARRHGAERMILRALCGIMPPPRDNQRAADFLHREIGTAGAAVRWVVVRPDTLVEGGPCAVAVHEHIVSSLFRPDRSRMSNVARFMCDLVTDAGTWERWAGRFPVIIDATGEGDTA